MTRTQLSEALTETALERIERLSYENTKLRMALNKIRDLVWQMELTDRVAAILHQINCAPLKSPNEGEDK